MEKRLIPKDYKVIELFCKTGDQLGSFKKIYGEQRLSDRHIYHWYNKKEIQREIIEIGNSLLIYDTVCDKTLIEIITNPNTNNRDKINAIKTWNDLRKRTTQQIAISAQTNIDFSNVTDENLEKIINTIFIEEKLENKIEPLDE